MKIEIKKIGNYLEMSFKMNDGMGYSFTLNDENLLNLQSEMDKVNPPIPIKQKEKEIPSIPLGESVADSLLIIRKNQSILEDKIKKSQEKIKKYINDEF